jgi:uncharacterized protein YkwD
LRRLAAAILAAPVIASIYVAALLAMPGARRSLAAIGATTLVAIVGIGLIAPPPASSIPPSTPNPVSAALLTPVQTDVATAPTPAATPEPTPLSATVKSPTRTTTAGTTTDPTPAAAHHTGNVPSATPKPAAVNHVTTTALTAPVRQATTARITGNQPAGNRIRPTSGITLRFDRPVTLKAVKAALAIKPVVKGTLKAVNTKVYTFTPAAALPANTAYTVSLAKPIKDADGVAVAAPKPMHLLTAAAPTLVRFRPSKGTAKVDPTQVISVRFNSSMNTSTTQKAFSVVVAGRKVAGKVSWAENNTVLVFTPLKALAKGSGVGIRVLGTATSTDGVPLKKGGSATFKVVPAPAPKPAATTKPKVKTVTHSSSGGSTARSGGSSLGGGSWAAAESYYLTLMNCTRTGGNVTSSGGCDSPGGRDVAPLWIDPGISANVSRPYAKYLAETGICSHFADGNPGTRLRRAGYDSYKWAENISCPKDMEPMALMVYTQQYFQAERSYGGGHYVNLMNAAYDRVGIGVWVANGRAEVVIDFYHP